MSQRSLVLPNGTYSGGSGRRVTVERGYHMNQQAEGGDAPREGAKQGSGAVGVLGLLLLLALVGSASKSESERRAAEARRQSPPQPQPVIYILPPGGHSSQATKAGYSAMPASKVAPATPAPRAPAFVVAVLLVLMFMGFGALCFALGRGG